jgi:ATP-dependent Clp protease protease subunit
MMHQPSGGIGGTAADIAIQAEQMIHTRRVLQDRIAFHTGQSIERIEEDSDRDRWFTADEAAEYGFVDRVVARAAQVPSAGPVS